MSKELEALKTIGDLDYIDEYDCRDGNLKRHFNEEFTIVEQALQRLEAIDNAEPREALEKLEVINNYGCGLNDNMKFSEVFEKEYNAIKNYILKAQEQEKEKYYKVMIRQYSIMYRDNLCYVKFIKTNDLYHWIGKYYSTALEKVERIDYQEIDEETFNKEKPRTYYKGELLNESL